MVMKFRSSPGFCYWVQGGFIHYFTVCLNMTIWAEGKKIFFLWLFLVIMPIIPLLIHAGQALMEIVKSFLKFIKWQLFLPKNISITLLPEVHTAHRVEVLVGSLMISTTEEWWEKISKLIGAKHENNTPPSPWWMRLYHSPISPSTI